MTNTFLKRSILLACLLFVCLKLHAQNILMFVSHEDTYYSEYIVMKEALEASGYVVEVRSASSLDFSIYMSPYTDIENVANDLSGSSYTEFQSQFEELFGESWDGASHNSIPSTAPVNGSILDVTDIGTYAGLIVVGGTGALQYRVDGDYQSQGTDEKLVSASDIQDAAERLNDLALQALRQGKPVMAQCHGASIPAFWRIPDTSGPDEEVLGYSLLKGGNATGFPESGTGPTLEALDITHRTNDRVTISSPHTSFDDNESGTSRIITTRDWYPQTVAHAARTFINILESYPKYYNRLSEISVLALHGGALDDSDLPSSCSPADKSNDVPCNNGISDSDLPADYTHLMELLAGSGSADDFNITASELDLSGSLSFDINNESEVLEELENYDVIIFFKHWSTFITDELQDALVTYADNGGGVLGLHHGLYNDVDNGQNKDILANELFGAHSTQSGWSATLTTYDVHSTNYGHFISSYLIDYDDAQTEPAAWSTTTLPSSANTAYSYLPTLDIYDELYNNMAFTGTIVIGRDINEITPLFSNDQSTNSIAHTTGFTREVDISEDGSIGRVVYFEIGERKENINSSSTFGQIVRNAVAWAANKETTQITWNGSSWSNETGPDATESAIITGDYTTTDDGNLDALDLTIDFGVNVTINPGGYIKTDGALTQNGGSLLVESGGSLITTGSVSGSAFSFERTTTFDQNTGRYSQVGSPIENASFDVLGANARIYVYDETEPYNPEGNLGMDRFKSPENLAITEMSPGTGYFSAFTGDANGKILFKGTPNTGEITVNLSLTDHPTAEDDYEGFNLLSNPYPTAISFSEFITANSDDIEGAIYIWDDFDSESARGTNEDYLIINDLGNVDSRKMGLSEWDGDIRSMQGFFVQAKSSGDLEVTFTDDMKETGNNSDAGFYRSTGKSTFKLALTGPDAYSETLIGMTADAQMGHDQYDARRFGSTYPMINSVVDGKSYAIQGIPYTEESVIELRLDNLDLSEHTIKLEEVNNLNGYKIILEDLYEELTIDLSSTETYQFTYQESQQDRFRIRISNAVVLKEDLKSDWVVYQDADRSLRILNPANEVIESVSVINLSGQRIAVRRSDVSNTWLLQSAIPRGLYVVRLFTESGMITKKVVLRF
ncbi:MAG: T9SS type A sorting domain-containing protein [Marinoscillum sp.]